MKKLTALILIFILLQGKLFSSDSTEVSRPNHYKLAVVSGVTAGAFIYAYGIQNNMWWKGEQSSFHLNYHRDWTYALGSDKYGHFYFGYLISDVYSQVFSWCGFNNYNSKLYAALLTTGYQTFLEVRDGFSEKYGFSWGDFAANLAGASFHLM